MTAPDLLIELGFVGQGHPARHCAPAISPPIVNVAVDALDFEVQRAAKEKPPEPDTGATLLPAEVTTAERQPEPEERAEDDEHEELDVQAVLAKLKRIGGKTESE